MVVVADPYPWPYDGALDLRRTALLIAGAQVGWAQRCPSAAAVQERIGDLAAVLRPGGAAVMLLRHRGTPGRRHPLPPAAGTPQWELAIEPVEGDLVVDAAGVDGFFGGALDGELRGRGIATLVLAGFGAEAAVDSTLRSANDRGYECLVLTDAVAPFDSELEAHVLDSVTMSGGIFGAIATTDALLSALPVLEAT